MQDEKRFYVYVHRRKTDGRIFYVGKGEGQRAWVTFRRNGYWKNVAGKHGFSVHIIAKFENEACAFSFERALIDFIGIKNPTNLRPGGDGGWLMTDEQKEKLRQRKLGRKQAPEHAIKSASAKTGKKVADTSRMNKDKARPVSNSAGEIFSSASEAARLMSERLGVNCSQGNISMCANGIRAKAYGLTWSYKIDEIPSERISRGPKKPLVCVETGQRFDSVSDAVLWVSDFRGSARNQCISYACRTGGSAYGYKWSYIDEIT